MTVITIINILLTIALSYLLFVKKLDNKKLFKLSVIVIALTSFIAILIYYQNLYYNYEFGILYGNIYNTHFCDEYRYFQDANILYDHLVNDGFSSLFNKTLPPWEFMDLSGHPGFGNYNIFVILLALLKFVGYKTTLDFITVKLIILPITLYFAYKLFKLYLNEKNALIGIGVLSLFPGYLLLNSILLRDNIIILFIIIAFYIILNTNIRLSVKLLSLIPILILFLDLRGYLAPIIVATVFFCFKNSKRIISIMDILIIGIITCTLIFFTTYKFTNGELMIFGGFSDEQIRILQENFNVMYGSGLLGTFKLFCLTFLNIFYVPPFISFIFSGMIYLIIFSLGNIASVLLSIVFIPLFIYLCIKMKDSKHIYLLKFTFYFTYLCGLMLMSKDGYIIVRLGMMWVPLFILIILIATEKLQHKTLKE